MLLLASRGVGSSREFTVPKTGRTRKFVCIIMIVRPAWPVNKNQMNHTSTTHCHDGANSNIVKLVFPEVL